ncbi:hypothetical protein MIMGU_mgv1a006015mg [Erythranthe guttata]|uniref:Uncharacterized protein n=1 Tax=Erythranthe guttata TaxID=4155 RepID=A0A022PT73_ERYGU|nr:hypothetical protein MIMGU_mgv1a006015mg [Erythranthe guttata]
MNDAAFPTLQHPLAILIDRKVLVVVLLHLTPHVLENIPIERHLLEARPRAPDPPLLVSLGPVDPLGPLTRYNVHHVLPQHLLFEPHPILILPRDRRVEHVEQRRVLVEGFPESRREEGRVVGPVDHAVYEQVGVDFLYQFENGVPRAIDHHRLVGHVVEPVEGIHDQQLVPLDLEILNFDCVPLLRDCIVLERDFKPLAVLCEPAARISDTGGRTEPWLGEIDPCDPELGGPVGPLGQCVDQAGPLEPVQNPKIDNVERRRPIGEFLDRFVGVQIRHLPERASRDVRLVRLQNLRRRYSARVERPSGAGQAGLEGSGEIVREPFRSVAVRRRMPLYLRQKFRRRSGFVAGDGLRALRQEGSMVDRFLGRNPFLLIPSTQLFHRRLLILRLELQDGTEQHLVVHLQRLTLVAKFVVGQLFVTPPIVPRQSIGIFSIAVFLHSRITTTIRWCFVVVVRVEDIE